MTGYITLTHVMGSPPFNRIEEDLKGKMLKVEQTSQGLTTVFRLQFKDNNRYLPKRDTGQIL